MGWTRGGGSSHGFPTGSQSNFFSASSVIGFGVYPSYVSVEYGEGADPGAFVGFAAAFGPAARVDPELGFGIDGRINADLMLAQGGIQVIAIGHPGAELVLMGTIGIGRY